MYKEHYPADVDTVMKTVFGEPDGLRDDARARYRRLADTAMRAGPSTENNISLGRSKLKIELAIMEGLDPLVDAIIRWSNKASSA